MVQMKKAFAAFAEAVADDDGDVKSRNSLLLSYVFTFEMAWKCLKLAEVERGMVVPDYAVAALKMGFQAGLIDDPAMWDKLREHRNNVAHAYDEEKAVAIAAFVRQYAATYFLKLMDRLARDD